MAEVRSKLPVALWASSHPGPTMVVTVLMVGLGAAAGLSFERLALLALAVFVGQLSVGISNDALDADRDRAVGRTDKPIAAGDIGIRAAWIGALTCLVLALLLSVPLGPGLLAAHAVMLASAWSYNVGLKAGAASILPFILGFGIFPSFATLSTAQPQFAAPWAWIAGAALGSAVHLTNVLPDLDDDARTGIRGLPHRMGGRPSAALAAAAVLAGAVAVTLGPAGGQIPQVPVLSWVFFGLVVVVVVVTLVLLFSGLVRSGRSGRVLFRLVMLAAGLLAMQLVLTGGSLAG